MSEAQTIEKRIYTIREQRVMLDWDLAGFTELKREGSMSRFGEISHGSRRTSCFSFRVRSMTL